MSDIFYTDIIRFERKPYMLDFTYYTPTKVVFGKNTEEQIGTLVKLA